MSTAAVAKPKKRGSSIMFGALLAIVCASIGFAVSSGFVQSLMPSAHQTNVPATIHDFEYVPVDQMTISLGDSGGVKHLKFTAQLEIASGYSDEVNFLMPRIVDVFNGFLRAVDVSELADPSYLIRLRSLLLRRVEIVVGPDIVRNLLIMEFVLN